MAKKEIITINKEREDSVFIIMPYGGPYDAYYKEIYVKAISTLKLKPYRLDDSNAPDVLVREMYELTKKSKIILADLTENKPNVCYELGLAHALNRPTIIISDSIENIPFDISGFRVITYDKDIPDWGKRLRQKIEQSIKEIISNPKKYEPLKLLTSETDDQNLKIQLLERQQQLLLRELGEQREVVRHSINRVHHNPRIGPQEATNLLRLYKKERRSRNFIINQLTSIGVPEEWVRKKLSSK